MNIKNIIRLAEIMNQHGLTEVEIKEADSCLRLSRGVPAAFTAAQATPAVTVAAPLPPDEAKQTAPADTESGAGTEGRFITAPMPGTFFASSAPDKEPYVTAGSRVTPQSVVCIVEAMKVMNEVKAECDGTIKQVLVANGSPVEYGQRLFELS